MQDITFNTHQHQPELWKPFYSWTAPGSIPPVNLSWFIPPTGQVVLQWQQDGDIVLVGLFATLEETLDYLDQHEILCQYSVEATMALYQQHGHTES